MSTTLLTTSIVTVKGTTIHGVANFDSEEPKPVPGSDTESPFSLSIVSNESGVFLLRLNRKGECIADTWHSSVGEAQLQAEFEFEIEATGWVEQGK